MMKTELILSELRAISKKNKGLLQPEKVVETAKDEKNILHGCFEWDDRKAGHEYRLYQARQIIRVSVEYSEATGKSFGVFVSLSTDRKHGGYREISDVIKDSHLRKIMLQDALREMELFTEKYREVVELAEVFDSMKKAGELLKSTKRISEKSYTITPRMSGVN